MSSPILDYGRALASRGMKALNGVAQPIENGAHWAESMLGMQPAAPQPQPSTPGLMTENAIAGRTAPAPPVASKPRMRLPQK
jgi:hypothetical protein